LATPPAATGDAEATKPISREEEKQRMERAKGARAKLIAIGGPRQGEAFEIDSAEKVIGRDPVVEISIMDASVSRKHAKISMVGDDQVSLTDLGSSNGTKVNGKPLTANLPVILTKEDVIEIGTTFLKFLPAGEVESVLIDDLGNLGLSDKLTGIANKRRLIQVMEPEFKRARAKGTPLCVVFMDLDFFKRINDTYGHAAGDFVLVAYASLVKGSFVGKHDLFARYGGEEFVLVLPGKSLDEAKRLSESIRAAVEAHAFIFEGKRMPVTSSVGLALLTDAVTDHDDLLKRADEALYKAKQTGRNRVVVADA